MAKSYSDLWNMAGDLEKQGKSVVDFESKVAKLPYELKDEFRKRQDPELDKAINKAQSDTFGAAIKGLDMYQGISNPFTRRNLAEQYQGGIEQGWKNLTDERTRRQGVYADYIEKWTGLYGAEAARQRDIYNNKLTTFNTYKSLADADEDKRRWEIENARAAARSGGSGSKDWTDQEIRAFVFAHKEDMSWEDQKNYLGEQGVDVTQGGTFDIVANTAWGTGNYPLRPTAQKELSPSEKLSELKYKEAISVGTGSKDNPYKSEKEAQAGDYYRDGNKIKQKKNWWIDPTL